MKHFIIYVRLYHITPEIWRRFRVPAHVTMARFHEFLQCAMGWEQRYEHEFRYGKGKYLRDVIAPPHADRFLGADSFTDEATLTLDQFVGRARLPKRFLYLYDYADEWLHEVTVEKAETCEGAEPMMLDGARACPPEACGGHLEYLELCSGNANWYEGVWDVEAFDMKAIDFSAKAKKSGAGKKGAKKK